MEAGRVRLHADVGHSESLSELSSEEGSEICSESFSESRIIRVTIVIIVVRASWAFRVIILFARVAILVAIIFVDESRIRVNISTSSESSDPFAGRSESLSLEHARASFLRVIEGRGRRGRSDTDSNIYQDANSDTDSDADSLTRMVAGRDPLPGDEGVVLLLELVTGRVRRLAAREVGMQPSPG